MLPVNDAVPVPERVGLLVLVNDAVSVVGVGLKVLVVVAVMDAVRDMEGVAVLAVDEGVRVKVGEGVCVRVDRVTVESVAVGVAERVGLRFLGLGKHSWLRQPLYGSLYNAVGPKS